MDIRLRFLTAEIAFFTAVASLLGTNTPEWTKVYEKRLYCEMQLNLWRGGNDQKALENMEVVLDEPPTVEEAMEWADPEPTPVERVPEVQPEVPSHPSEAQVEADRQSYAPLYLVEGDQLDLGVAEYLYQRLCEAGIGWFYEYALCLAYQESSFNPLAENVNGRDKGLFQFRVEYHPTLTWQNPYSQVDLFVAMMANRSAAGCDVYSMISRHNTSDYCPEINPVYIAQVLSHFSTLQRIR